MEEEGERKRERNVWGIREVYIKAFFFGVQGTQKKKTEKETWLFVTLGAYLSPNEKVTAAPLLFCAFLCFFDCRGSRGKKVRKTHTPSPAKAVTGLEWLRRGLSSCWSKASLSSSPVTSPLVNKKASRRSSTGLSSLSRCLQNARSSREKAAFKRKPKKK